MRRQRCLGDCSGAFADGAILFPLLVGLAWQTGASATIMLLTSAAAYLAAAVLFRLPIPVQPLKSLAITALAVGASLAEIRLAGAIIGALFLLIALVDINRLARLVPDTVVHGIQLALGVILVLKALALIGFQPLPLAGVAAAVFAILAFGGATGRPVLGGVAVVALLWGLWEAAPATAADAEATVIRPSVMAMLILPQIALSLTNAVLGTQRTAQAYFNRDADRVTPRRLLCSLGFGNLAVASVGGLPFCHGSGGVTAHVHGGSRSEWSNVVIATALIALALILHFGDGGLPDYPVALQAILLGVVGLLHLRLAAPSWRSSQGRPVLLVMGGAALATQNMLVVLVMGCVWLVLRNCGPQMKAALSKPQGEARSVGGGAPVPATEVAKSGPSAGLK